MKLRLNLGSRRYNKMKKKKTLKPSRKTNQGTSLQTKIKTNSKIATNQDQISGLTAIIATTPITSSKDDPTQGTMPTETRWPASSANGKVTVRRNAGKGSMPINLAWTQTVKTFGRKSIPPKMGHKFNPSRSSIFNSELDGTPTSSFRRHSSNYYESMCCLNDYL